MKKLLVLALLSLSPITAIAWDQRPNSPISECSDGLPFGVPMSVKVK